MQLGSSLFHTLVPNILGSGSFWVQAAQCYEGHDHFPTASSVIHGIADIQLSNMGLFGDYRLLYIFSCTFFTSFSVVLVSLCAYLLTRPCSLINIPLVHQLLSSLNLVFPTLSTFLHMHLPEIFLTTLHITDQNVSSSMWIWCQWGIIAVSLPSHPVPRTTMHFAIKSCWMTVWCWSRAFLLVKMQSAHILAKNF